MKKQKQYFGTVSPHVEFFKIKPALLALVVTGLLISSFARAGEWTVGGLIGHSTIHDIEDACFTPSCEFDDSDRSLGINVGYQFNDNWGLELGYLDLGTVELRESFRGLGVRIEGDASAVYLVGRGTYQFTDRWSVTARLGAASADATASAVQAPIQVSADADSEAVIGGLALDYHFSDHLKAGVRFDQIGDIASSIGFALESSFGR